MASFDLQVIHGTAPSGTITESTISAALGPGQVYIETTHSGLCGTDLGKLTSGYVLGHEGIGIIRAVGEGVSNVAVGDRVGFGYTYNICGACEPCLGGYDQYCVNRSDYSMNRVNMGSIGTGAVWNANTVFKIPEGYASENAAPMLCAGATIFTILDGCGVKPTDRVGIMGIGGLGHLAIKLAAGMGCDVVVLSRSEDKRAEAMSYGANEFYVFDPAKGVPEGWDQRGLKHLLLTGSAPSKDFLTLIQLMAVNGTIYPLGVSREHTPIMLTAMITKGIRIQASLTASRQTINKLLDFVARHNITPTVQAFPMTVAGAEQAIEALKSGKMRYRGVLVR
ncbi:chaperonin 10-like protein [Talaromyces proteolyticus]|uniref:Chaperonin 10-like protein n=1 Tax=Talaromyces proteolyticus TaxID=1131652 RepID=A0AAD4PT18_9EURO|nr:chaperonin 10-like protein [Talaromyces proteolyticus]KAH8690054.1 chaperonin 10-like protein [Talaromyces proteolyticus]